MRTLASIYHATKGTTFYVESRTLGFLVIVLYILEMPCITLLMYRRFQPIIEADLEGPKSYRVLCSSFFVSLSFIS